MDAEPTAPNPVAWIVRRCWQRSGLTQPEIAAKARCTEQWFRKIMGGEANVSTALLDRLADALAMTDDERHLLREAAGPPPLKPAAALPADLEAIAQEMQDSPHAGMLIDLDFTVLSVNEACRCWLPHLKPQDNLLRWIMTDPAARRQLNRWQEWAGLFWGEASARWSEHRGCPALNRVYQELSPAGSDLPAGSIETSGLYGKTLSLLIPGGRGPTPVRVLGFTPSSRPHTGVTGLLLWSSRLLPLATESGESCAVCGVVVPEQGADFEHAPLPVGVAAEVDVSLAGGAWRIGGQRKVPRSVPTRAGSDPQ